MNRLVQGRALAPFLVSLFALSVRAGEPPTFPLFSVEVDTHTAMIRRVAVNEARGIIVTASDDKTARVWDLESGRLLNVLRFAIDAQQEGRLFALALHPNGRVVAVAGWTGWDWDGAASVYVFDVDTGEMLHRLPAVPNIVGYMSFSKKGEFLAVGLGGTSGVRIYRAADLRLVAEDNAYGETVLGIDFDAEGRMVTTSLDGYVRLYDPSFNLVKKRRVDERFTPVFVRFSPDGTKLGVGSYSSRVAVLSANDLSLLYTPTNEGMRDQKDLPGVAWSPDGQSLFAIGDFAGSEDTPIYRWDAQGRGKLTALPTARLRITALEPLRDGRVVYTAEDPVLGLMDTTGAKIWVQATAIADFRDIGEALRVSHDGAAIQFAYGRGGKDVAHFALLESEGIVPGSLPPEGTLGPITKSPHLAVTDFKDHLEPKLNGRPLLLDRWEYSRSLAIAPDGQSFLLGSEWTLRLFDRKGGLYWQVPLSQIPWGLAVSGNGRLAVAALSDGTIRWYSMKEGRELFALFSYKPPRAEDRQWIAWTPEGFYDSSEYGDNYVGWHINRARDQASDFYRAVQFERILYRPTDVAEYFSCMLGMTDIDCEALSSPDLSRLTANVPPRFGPLTITPEEATSGRARALLRFSARRRTLPIEDYAVFVNNIPMTPGLERRLEREEREGFTRDVTLDLVQRDNIVRVEVSSGRSVGVTERYVRIPGLPSAAEPAPGDLYLLAVGVNRFPKLDAGWQLRYAVKDAIAIKQSLEQLGGVFKQVRSKTLSDDEGDPPDKGRIIEALEFIKSARAQDTVVVFLSSHGLSDLEQNYYLVPRDARLQDVQRVQEGQGEGAPSLIGWETFFEALRNAAGRRLLIVDSCKAKSIEGRFGAQWLKKRSASARFALMVSSKGRENSLEDARFGHGIFTHALLKGMRTACDGGCKGSIRLRHLFDFIVPTVEQLRAPEAGQQTPQLSAPEELRNMILGQPSRQPFGFGGNTSHLELATARPMNARK